MLPVRAHSVVVLMALGFSGCGDLPPSDTAIRHVILYNDGAPSVTIAKDLAALQTIINAIKDPSDAAKAQMKAAEVDGRLFQVENGTRADVLKEVPITAVADMSLLRVRIRSGPRSTEEGLCFSSVTQPDAGR